MELASRSLPDLKVGSGIERGRRSVVGVPEEMTQPVDASSPLSGGRFFGATFLEIRADESFSFDRYWLLYN